MYVCVIRRFTSKKVDLRIADDEKRDVRGEVGDGSKAWRKLHPAINTRNEVANKGRSFLSRVCFSNSLKYQALTRVRGFS